MGAVGVCGWGGVVRWGVLLGARASPVHVTEDRLSIWVVMLTALRIEMLGSWIANHLRAPLQEHVVFYGMLRVLTRNPTIPALFKRSCFGCVTSPSRILSSHGASTSCLHAPKLPVTTCTSTMAFVMQSPAMQALAEGCQELDLPVEAALELFRFLSVKRVHAALPASSRGIGLSPGTDVDQLWHWMLLNTEVRATSDIIAHWNHCMIVDII